MAIILISSELEEVRAMSDRIVVMRMGRVAGIFETPAERDVIMAAAAGVRSGQEVVA